MKETEEHILAGQIMRWLDTPLRHLGDESRREAIEGLLIAHADRVRRAAERRARAQGVAMYGGLIGLALTLILNSGRALEVMGW